MLTYTQDSSGNIKTDAMKYDCHSNYLRTGSCSHMIEGIAVLTYRFGTHLHLMNVTSMYSVRYNLPHSHDCFAQTNGSKVLLAATCDRTPSGVCHGGASAVGQ